MTPASTSGAGRRVLVALWLLAVAGCLIALALRPARAHDWYPPDCCSGRDCFPVADDAVTPMPGGAYLVGASGAAVQASQVRTSQDGRYHLCTRTGEIDGQPLCLFEPQRSY